MSSRADTVSGLRAAVLDVGARAFEENTTVFAEVELTPKEGTITVEMRAAPVGTEEFVVFVRDITIRKHLEAEAVAMLEKERQVSEMKTRFISVTSHEFRTPMAAAVGSVELLHNHYAQMSPAKREELFKRIDESVLRMTQMLDQILTLSRIDTGRIKAKFNQIDLRQFTQNVMEEIQMGDRGAHSFVLTSEGEAWELCADPSILHHILSNLLSNAARFSPSGTTISLRLCADKSHFSVSVEDQGIGILEADRERIFEPFERGMNVGTIKGSGLGLNIVKHMTDMLGGSISFESVLNQGSCFTLKLPRDIQPLPQ